MKRLLKWYVILRAIGVVIAVMLIARLYSNEPARNDERTAMYSYLADQHIDYYHRSKITPAEFREITNTYMTLFLKYNSEVYYVDIVDRDGSVLYSRSAYQPNALYILGNDRVFKFNNGTILTVKTANSLLSILAEVILLGIAVGYIIGSLLLMYPKKTQPVQNAAEDADCTDKTCKFKSVCPQKPELCFKRVKQLESELDDFLNIASSPVIITTPDLHIIKISRIAAAVVGYTPEFPELQSYLTPDSLEHARATIAALLQDGSKVSAHLRMQWINRKTCTQSECDVVITAKVVRDYPKLEIHIANSFLLKEGVA